MNIPQMLSHRGSETHMYVINNAKDLRLKMATGRSHEPWDGGSRGLVLLRGAAGEGLGGAWPHVPALCLVLHGVGKHHRGSQH